MNKIETTLSATARIQLEFADMLWNNFVWPDSLRVEVKPVIKDGKIYIQIPPLVISRNVEVTKENKQ